MNRIFQWIVLVVSAASILACGNNSGIPAIATPADYEEVLAEVEKLSSPIFMKSDSGEVLTQKDQEELTKALKLFKGLSAFNPGNPSPYFGIGKCEQLLGNYEASLANFEMVVTASKGNDNWQVQDMVAETQYLSSISFERIKAFKEAKMVAESATQLKPQSAVYWAALGSAEMQLGELDLAKKHLKKALNLDPLNKRARYLMRMIDISKEG